MQIMLYSGIYSDNISYNFCVGCIISFNKLKWFFDIFRANIHTKLELHLDGTHMKFLLKILEMNRMKRLRS